MKGKIVISRSRDKQFYFVIVRTNGRIVATSETYKRKQSAIKTAKSCFPSYAIVDMT